MVASINTNGISNYDYRINPYSKDIETEKVEEFINLSAADSSDEFEYTNNNTTISTVNDLKNDLEAYTAEQGFFGKAIDKVANKLPFLSKIGISGSNEINEIISKAEAGEITIEEAKEAIEKYKSKNETTKEIVLDTITIAAASGACLLLGPLGLGVGAIIGIATGTGALARLGLGATEAATNEVKGDYKLEDAQEDITKGGIIGFFVGASKVIGTRIPKKLIREASDPNNNRLIASNLKVFKGLTA